MTSTFKVYQVTFFYVPKFICKSNLELEKYHLFFTKLTQSANGVDTGILSFPLILPPAQRCETTINLAQYKTGYLQINSN